jgi:hypothetical protein
VLVAASPTDASAGGEQERRAAAAPATTTATTTTTTTTTAAAATATGSSARLALRKDLSVLVFDAAVPPSGLAPAQIERLAAQMVPLLDADDAQEDEDELPPKQRGPESSASGAPLHRRRRVLVAEGATTSTPALERALAQLADALGATLALSEPPDPRRALEVAAGGQDGGGGGGSSAAAALLAGAAEASLAAGRADFAAAQQKQQQQQQQQEEDRPAASTPDPGPLPAAAALAPFATRVPSRRLDLPDLALRPRPPEAPGSLRRRNSSWARALELAYFLLQLNAAGIGFRLHRVGEDDDTDSDDSDDDDDDDDDFLMMADSSDDDDSDSEDDDGDEDGDEDDETGSGTTGVERASDASIRMGGPGIWEIFSGPGGGKQKKKQEGEEAEESEDGEEDGEGEGDSEEGAGNKRRRNKAGKPARNNTLSITFARPDALRGELGRKLFGGRTRGPSSSSTPLPPSASSPPSSENGGSSPQQQGSGDAAAAEDDDVAAADAEAAERARLYRIAEGFETDDGDLPTPEPTAATAEEDEEEEEEGVEKAPPPRRQPPPVPLASPPAAPASAADAIAALDSADSFDDDEEDGGPFEVVSVRPEGPGEKGGGEEEDGGNEDGDGDSDGDGDQDGDGDLKGSNDLTDEQMGAVAAEVLADAREGELRGARTLRLTGVGLGDMVLLASGLLAVSQVSGDGKREENRAMRASERGARRAPPFFSLFNPAPMTNPNFFTLENGFGPTRAAVDNSSSHSIDLDRGDWVSFRFFLPSCRAQERAATRRNPSPHPQSPPPPHTQNIPISLSFAGPRSNQVRDEHARAPALRVVGRARRRGRRRRRRGRGRGRRRRGRRQRCRRRRPAVKPAVWWWRRQYRSLLILLPARLDHEPRDSRAWRRPAFAAARGGQPSPRPRHRPRPRAREACGQGRAAAGAARAGRACA